MAKRTNEQKEGRKQWCVCLLLLVVVARLPGSHFVGVACLLGRIFGDPTDENKLVSEKNAPAAKRIQWVDFVLKRQNVMMK